MGGEIDGRKLVINCLIEEDKVGELNMVFSEDYIEKLEKRFGKLLNYEQPYYYRFATAELTKYARQQVEVWVANLPSSKKVNVVARLRSERNFKHTYNELAAGNVLRGYGFTIEYEKSFSILEESGQNTELTPDWFISPKSDVAKDGFILEIFTADLSEEMQKQIDTDNCIFGELSRIESSFSIVVRLENQNSNLTKRQIKQTVSEIGYWLTLPSICIGDEFYSSDGEIYCKVVHHNPKWNTLQLMGPARSQMVNKEPMRRNLKEKIKKYSEIAKNYKLPVVVGIFSNFYTGLGWDDFEDVLLGQEAVSFLVNRQTGEHINQGAYRKSNGIFLKEDSPLSAALWFNGNVQEGWNCKSLHNPNARFPLPESTFL